LPHRLLTHRISLIDTGLSLSRKQLPTTRAVITDDVDLLHVPPTSLTDPMSDTPAARRARVWIVALVILTGILVIATIVLAAATIVSVREVAQDA
jgi:hypothetical protein